MPSLIHDSLNQLFRDYPDFAASVLRDRLGVRIPAGLQARVAHNDLNDRPSRDFYPDTVITLGPAHDPVCAIVVEIQHKIEESKRPALPRYAATLWLWLDCPIYVLVVCPTDRVAKWAAEPILTKLPGYVHTPQVLGPAQIPAIIDAAQAAAQPELAILSVMTHGLQRPVARAFVEAMKDIPYDHYPYYYDYGFELSSLSIRKILEELMKTVPESFMSPFTREHFGRGRQSGLAEGEVKGEVKGILTVLRARGVAVSAAAEARIKKCTDLARLDEWLRLSATITSVDELFTGQE
ncbi:MAG TPA: hypothetical protein VIR33_09340 [Thermopolyspora sp.]|jgi:hypothetical protein